MSNEKWFCLLYLGLLVPSLRLRRMMTITDKNNIAIKGIITVDTEGGYLVKKLNTRTKHH